MARWLVRSAILLLISATLAVADATVRAIPPKQPPTTTNPPTPPDQTTPTLPEHDNPLWLQQQLAAGTAFALDARPLDQYTAGHIPGAYHLPFEAFTAGRPAILDILPDNLTLVIYCSGGDCDASHKVQTMLRSYGYANLIVFEPGWPAWQQAGLPSQQGPPEAFE